MRRLCFGITRSLVIIVNLIITTLALLLIYVSINAFDQDYELDTFNDTHPRLVHTYVSILCAGLGLISALLALLGLIGAVKKSKSILATYAVIMFSISILLCIIGVLSYSINASASSYKDIDKSFVNSTVVVYNHVDSSDMKTKIIDKIQKSFACCGVNSPNDWAEYSLHKIPKSCCSDPVESSLPVYKYCAESDYKIGCWKALTDHFHANLDSVRSILFTFSTFGLICGLAGAFMIRTLRKSLDVV